MDMTALAQELLRALRGSRTQQAFAKRLNCAESVVYSWECGRRQPSASRFLDIVRVAGVDVRAALGQFLRSTPSWLETEHSHADTIVELLNDLRGSRTLVDIAKAAGRSRFRVARWFSGHTQPRLPDLLLLIHVTSYRLLDFIAALVDPAQLETVAPEWQRLNAARRVAYESPWCHVVLRLLETNEFARRVQVTAGDIASALEITTTAAASSLDLLVRSGEVLRIGETYRVQRTDNVDMAQDPEAVRRLKRWAAQIGVDRIEAGKPGLYSYNLFCVSEKDYERLQVLHRAYFRQLRAIVAESEPSERAVMVNLQLFSLHEPTAPSKRR